MSWKKKYEFSPKEKRKKNKKTTTTQINRSKSNSGILIFFSKLIVDFDYENALSQCSNSNSSPDAKGKIKSLENCIDSCSWNVERKKSPIKSSIKSKYFTRQLFFYSYANAPGIFELIVFRAAVANIIIYSLHVLQQ